MKSKIDLLKGIHPGLVIEHHLKKLNMPKGRFALSINEYPQTLSAVISGKRGINLPLSLKMEKALGYDEGFFMILQVYYDVAKSKQETGAAPQKEHLNLNPILFWDTKPEHIDWQKHKQYVIRRVLERGSQEDKEQIVDYYGTEEVDRYRGEPDARKWLRYGK